MQNWRWGRGSQILHHLVKSYMENWFFGSKWFVKTISEPCMMWISVVVCRTDVHKGCMMAKGKKPEPDSVKDVYHAGDAGELAERDNALPGLVDHLLVVDQADFFLQACVQQGHVIWLGLKLHFMIFILITAKSRLWNTILLRYKVLTVLNIESYLLHLNWFKNNFNAY